MLSVWFDQMPKWYSDGLWVEKQIADLASAARPRAAPQSNPAPSQVTLARFSCYVSPQVTARSCGTPRCRHCCSMSQRRRTRRKSPRLISGDLEDELQRQTLMPLLAESKARRRRLRDLQRVDGSPRCRCPTTEQLAVDLAQYLRTEDADRRRHSWRTTSPRVNPLPATTTGRAPGRSSRAGSELPAARRKLTGGSPDALE